MEFLFFFPCRIFHIFPLWKPIISDMLLLTPKSSTTFCPVWKYFDMKHNDFMPPIAAPTLVQLVMTVCFLPYMVSSSPPPPKFKCKQLSEQNRRRNKMHKKLKINKKPETGHLIQSRIHYFFNRVFTEVPSEKKEKFIFCFLPF